MVTDERAYEVPDRNCRPVLLDRWDCDSQSANPAMDQGGVAAMTDEAIWQWCLVCQVELTQNRMQVCDRCIEQARRRQKEEDEA